MTANRLQVSIASGILLLSAVACFQAYPELPDLMASNFGGDGTPGGWSSKKSFMIIYGVSMAFWFGALLATPLLAANPRQSFDEPTRLWLRDTIGWFLVFSLAFSAAVTQLVIDANLRTGRLSSVFVWLLAAYMSYVVWWTVRLIRRTGHRDRNVTK